MNLADVIEHKKFGGYATVELIRDGKDGPKVLSRETVHNLVVNAGKRQTWRQASGLNANDWDQFVIGTSAAAATSAQVGCLSPITTTGGHPQNNTADVKTLLSGTRTFQLVISYPSGGGSISVSGIAEVSVLNTNTASGASALMRATFTAVNKTAQDKLKITYNVRIT